MKSEEFNCSEGRVDCFRRVAVGRSFFKFQWTSQSGPFSAVYFHDPGSAAARNASSSVRSPNVTHSSALDNWHQKP